ncbi:hypothetical protein WG66_008234, partial [Moniliophthora roreri]
MNKILPKLM